MPQTSRYPLPSTPAPQPQWHCQIISAIMNLHMYSHSHPYRHYFYYAIYTMTTEI